MKEIPEGWTYLCYACCRKAKLTIFNGKLIAKCPDHPVMIIPDMGETIRQAKEAKPHAKD